MLPFIRFSSLLVALVLVAGCQDSCQPPTEPPVSVPDMSVPCPEVPVCKETDLRCGANGQVVACVKNEQGCWQWGDEAVEVCEDNKWCYNGGCFSLPDDEEIPGLPDGQPPLEEQGLLQVPLPDSVVVISQTAFERAIKGRYYEQPSEELVKLASDVASLANTPGALGVSADTKGERYFEGDIFIVLKDPHLIRGSSDTGTIESDFYDVVVAKRLSGYSEFVSYQALVHTTDISDSREEKCCGTKNKVCTPQNCPIPGDPGGPRPVEEMGDALPDSPIDTCPDLTGPHRQFLEPYLPESKQDMPFRLGGRTLDPNNEDPKKRSLKGSRIASSSLVLYSPPETLGGQPIRTNADCETCAAYRCDERKMKKMPDPTPCFMPMPEMCQMVSAIGAMPDCPTQMGIGTVVCANLVTSNILFNTRAETEQPDVDHCGNAVSALPEVCNSIECQNGDTWCSEVCDPENKDSYRQQALKRVAHMFYCGRDLSPDLSNLPPAQGNYECCGEDGKEFCACEVNSTASATKTCVRCDANGTCEEFGLSNEALTQTSINTDACGGAKNCGKQVDKLSGKNLEKKKTLSKKIGEFLTRVTKLPRYGSGGESKKPPSEQTPKSDFLSEKNLKKTFNRMGEKIKRVAKEIASQFGRPDSPDTSTGDGNREAMDDYKIYQQSQAVNYKPDAIIDRGGQGKQQSRFNQIKQKVADPVIVSSGEMYANVTDISFAGPVVPLSFERFYRSRSDERSVLGSNWTHSYDMRVEVITPYNRPGWASPIITEQYPFPRAALIRYPDGSSRVFYLDDAWRERFGIYVFMPQAGSTDTLYYENKTWFLRTADSTLFVFNEYGSLVERRDRFGNGFTVEYESTPYFAVYKRYCGVSVGYFKQKQFDPRACSLLADNLGFGSPVVVTSEGWKAPENKADDHAVRLPIQYLNPKNITNDTLKVLTGDELRRIRKQNAYVSWWMNEGAAPRTKTGKTRQRPVRVVDDLGRKIEFEYYDFTLSNSWGFQLNTNPTDYTQEYFNYGLLKAVNGPEGARVEFTYGKPQNYPKRLHEAFLTETRRVDGTPNSPSLVASRARKISYTYNWPNNSTLSYDRADLDDYENKFRKYYGYMSGCGFKGGGSSSVCSTVGEGTACLTEENSCRPDRSCLPPGSWTEFSTTNPCVLARQARDRVVSQIADNLIKVQRSGTKPGDARLIQESLTRYSNNPNLFDFDRVIEQQYGGFSASEYDAPVQSPSSGSGHPQYKLTYTGALPVAASSDPSEGSKDKTEIDSRLKTIRDFYPLEDEVQEPIVLGDIISRGGTNACNLNEDESTQDYTPQCDKESLEHQNVSDSICQPNQAFARSGLTLGFTDRYHKYYELQESQPDPKHPKLYRSRIPCEDIRFIHASDPTHNGNIRAVINDRWELIPGTRDAIEKDMRRICAWTITTDREENVTYFGLNFRGQVVVSAAEIRQNNTASMVNGAMTKGFRIQETIYNADGNVIEARRFVDANEPGDLWKPSDGYTRFEYDELTPVGNDAIQHKAFWWTRRGNLTKVQHFPAHNVSRTHPKQTPVALAWDGQSRTVSGEKVEYTQTTIRYEPLFNQPYELTTSIKTEGQAQHEDLRRVLYDFDYQELTLAEYWPLVKAYAVWGYPYYVALDSQNGEGNKSAVAEVRFYGYDLNGDKYADGRGIRGFPTPDGERNLLSIRGAPVRMHEIDVRANKTHTTLIRSSFHGLPSFIAEPNGKSTFFRYYLNKNQADQEDFIYGVGAGPDQLAGDALGRGFLAQVAQVQYEGSIRDEPSQDAPHNVACDVFKGPYRWILPNGCQDANDAKQQMANMGLTDEVQNLLLKQSDEKYENGDIFVRSMAYNKAGHPKVVWSNEHASPDQSQHQLERYVYDLDGRVVEHHDRLGNVTKNGYSVHGPILYSAVFDAQQTLQRFQLAQYDDENNVVTSCQSMESGQCMQALGLSASCETTPSIQCLEGLDSKAPIEWGLGKANRLTHLLTQYRYTPNGHLKKQLMPSGEELTRTYDERGLVQNQSIIPNDDGQRLSVPSTTPAQQTDWVYDNEGLVVKMTHKGATTYSEEYVYDGFNRLVTQKDTRQKLWQVGYDVYSQAIASKRGDQPYGVSNSAAEFESLKQHDGFGRLLRSSQSGLIESEFEYAPKTTLVKSIKQTGLAKVWQTHSALGAPVWSLDADGNQSFSIVNPTTRSAYSINIKKDPETQQYLATTTKQQGRWAVGEPDVVTVFGHKGTLTQVSEVYRDAVGRVQKTINPEGFQSNRTFNLLNWTQTQAEAKDKNASSFDDVRYDYNLRGQITDTYDPRSINEHTIFRYDGFGRLAEEVKPRPGNTPTAMLQPTTRVSYDSHGRIASKWILKQDGKEDRLDHEYDARGDLTAIKWAKPGESFARPFMSWDYDDIGRVRQHTMHNLTLQDLGYANTSVTHTMTYDAIGRLTEEQMVNGSARYRTKSTYALTPNQTWMRTLESPSGRTFERISDNLGRLSRIVNPAESQTTTLKWFGGMYKGRTHQSGLPNQDPFTEARQFDGLSRLTQFNYQAIELQQGTPANAAWGNQYCHNQTWQSDSCAAPLFEGQLRYDVVNRIVSNRQRFGQPTLNAQNQLVTTSSRPHPWKGYAYSVQGHLTTEWLNDTVDEQSFAQLPNHTATLAALESVATSGQGKKWLWNREGKVGSLLSIERADDPTITRWKHTDMAGQNTVRDVGHRLKRVEAHGKVLSMVYDAQGRMTNDGQYEYVYDVLGRLVLIKDASNQQTLEAYLYDTGPRLIRVDDSTSSQHLAYDGLQMLASFDQSQNLKWEAIWGAGGDHLLGWSDGQKDYSVLSDERNNVLGLWDANTATMNEQVTYDAQGNTTLVNNQNNTSCDERIQDGACLLLGGKMPFTFNGMWRSNVTGLSFMRHRWYSPRLGQFISHDPLLYVDSFNPYVFAGLDPINGWDPMGLSVQSFVSNSSRKFITGGLNLAPKFLESILRDTSVIPEVDRKLRQTAIKRKADALTGVVNEGINGLYTSAKFGFAGPISLLPQLGSTAYDMAVNGKSFKQIHPDFIEHKNADQKAGALANVVGSVVVGGGSALKALATPSNVKAVGAAIRRFHRNESSGISFGSAKMSVMGQNDPVPVGSYVDSGYEVFYGARRNVTRIGDDLRSRRVAHNAKEESDIHDFVAHGAIHDADGSMIYVGDAFPLHSQQAGNAILENPSYTGETLRMLTCYGGCGGANSPAAMLSSQLGVDVYAATGRVGVAQAKGSTPEILDSGATWLKFSPDGTVTRNPNPKFGHYGEIWEKF